MKLFPQIAWAGIVLLAVIALTGTSIRAQAPPTATPVTQPAKPPVIAPVPDTKQVSVPARSEDKAAETKAATRELEKKSTGQTSPAVLDSKGRGPYVIGPEDALAIRVWDQPNLSGPVTVGPDGMISLPLIDEVKAEGLSTEQLKRLLTERLKSFINEPDVNVLVVRVNSRKFIIQGEVLRPGSFPLTGAIPVMEALVFAGGFREFAKPTKIYILRQEVDANGKNSVPKKYKFNYKEVIQGKHMEQNILVKSGDLIVVP